MTIQVMIIFFFGCLISSSCLAQSENEVIPIVHKKDKINIIPPGRNGSGKKVVPVPINNAFDVQFITTENCSLKVGDNKLVRITKGNPKTVKLNVGKNKLTFINDATGKRLDSSFILSRDMINAGTYTYTVTFKSNLAHSEKSEKTNSPKMPPKPVEDEKLKRKLAVINELSSNMVLIPGGNFIMGVRGGRLKALLPHNVTIDSVKLGKYEVTQQQWEAIMGIESNNSSNKGCGNCPVENVSWNEVDSFITKINDISKNKFRLPTEAEWEYVAKMAIEKEIGTSDKATESKVEELLEQTAWYNKNSEGKTHPVGNKKSLSGIHDLLGNVAEWCLDYYRPDYQKDNPINPRGPSSGQEKLVKGGSFNDKDDLKPSVRNKENPSTRKNTIGFRLVMKAN